MSFMYGYMNDIEMGYAKEDAQIRNEDLHISRELNAIMVEHVTNLNDIETDVIVEGYDNDDLTAMYEAEMAMFYESLADVWHNFIEFIKKIWNKITGKTEQIKNADIPDPNAPIELEQDPANIKKTVNVANKILDNLTNYRKEDGKLDKTKIAIELGISGGLAAGAIAAFTHHKTKTTKAKAQKDSEELQKSVKEMVDKLLNRGPDYDVAKADKANARADQKAAKADQKAIKAADKAAAKATKASEKEAKKNGKAAEKWARENGYSDDTIWTDLKGICSQVIQLVNKFCSAVAAKLGIGHKDIEMDDNGENTNAPASSPKGEIGTRNKVKFHKTTMEKYKNIDSYVDVASRSVKNRNALRSKMADAAGKVSSALNKGSYDNAVLYAAIFGDMYSAIKRAYGKDTWETKGKRTDLGLPNVDKITTLAALTQNINKANAEMKKKNGFIENTVSYLNDLMKAVPGMIKTAKSKASGEAARAAQDAQDAEDAKRYGLGTESVDDLFNELLESCSDSCDEFDESVSDDFADLDGLFSSL